MANQYSRALRQLTQRIAKLENDRLIVRPTSAAVVAVDRREGTVDLELETGPEDENVIVESVPYSASYYPQVGQTALIHRIGDQMLAVDNTHTDEPFDEATFGRAELTMGPELILDPDFSSTTTGWVPGESTVAQWMFDVVGDVTSWQNVGVGTGEVVPEHQPPVTDPNFSQNGGAMIFVPPSAGDIRLLSPHFAAAPIAGDATYKASLSVRASVFSGRRAYLNLRWYTNSGGTTPHSVTPVSSGPLSATTSQDWTRLAIDALAPVGTIRARLEVVVEQVSADEIYRFDTGFVLGASTSVIARNSGSVFSAIDTFDRANVTSPVSPTGNPWTARRGTWGITNGRAYLSAAGGGTRNILTMLGLPEGTITTTLPTNAADGQGFIFRYVDDSNYWFLTWIAGYQTWVLWKRVAGVDASVASAGSGAPSAAGTKIAIDFPGNAMGVYLNDRIHIFAEDATHRYGASHGLFSTGAQLGARWDDWKLTGDAESYLFRGTPTLEIKSTAPGMATARTPIGDAEYLPCNGGEEYLISVRSRNRRTNAAPRLASIGAAFFAEDGGMLETKISSPTQTTWEWSRVISTIVVPAGATKMRIYVGFLAMAADEYAYFDDASCRRATSVTSAALRMGQPGQPRIEVLPNNNLTMAFHPTDDPNDVAGSIEAFQNKMRVTAPHNSLAPAPTMELAATRFDLTNPINGTKNWITHSPSSNWNWGSEPPRGRYWTFNQTCFYEFYLKLGVGSVAGGALFINLPFSMNVAGNTRPAGSLVMYDGFTSGDFHIGIVSMREDNARLYFHDMTGLVGGSGVVTNVSPFTWGQNCELWGSITYQMKT